MKTLASVLARPGRIAEFAPQQWQALIREARQARMMDRLRSVLVREAPDMPLPSVVAEVFDGTHRYVEYLQHRARYEVSRLCSVAEAVDYPVVLLKGAAYVVEGIPAGEGRGLSDIDVLVPHASLTDAERHLTAGGWRFTEDLDAYDNYYYRELAHELPPMRHPDRHFELDVHHGIIQPTHRLKPDSARWFEDALPLGDTAFYRLSRRDQVLHSATHLFMSDELRGGLRDLHDIVLLCREGEAEAEDFWGRLVERAGEQGLQRPLHYAIHCAQRGLGLRVPGSIQAGLDSLRPRGLAARFAETLFLRRFFSPPTDRLAGLTDTLLYWRSHWIRMPPGLLLRHLSRKALS
ncbi:MAG: nucleotidyltransferase family protein [Chromatocurvus sp.]